MAGISNEPPLDLNAVERQEIQESKPLAAGSTDPYQQPNPVAQATGGYAPGGTPASDTPPGRAGEPGLLHAGDGLRDAGGRAQVPGTLLWWGHWQRPMCSG